MQKRTRRILVGAGIGLLPSLIIIGAAVAVEVFVETGGGLFGVIAIPLAVVGVAIGIWVGATEPGTPRNPTTMAVIGAIPGLVLGLVFNVLALPVIILGAWIGYRLGQRSQPPADMSGASTA